MRRTDSAFCFANLSLRRFLCCLSLPFSLVRANFLAASSSDVSSESGTLSLLVSVLIPCDTAPSESLLSCCPCMAVSCDATEAGRALARVLRFVGVGWVTWKEGTRSGDWEGTIGVLILPSEE